jgi:hypothetical protein
MSNYLCMPLRKARLMFDKIDANGDGKVGGLEYPEYRQSRLNGPMCTGGMHRRKQSRRAAPRPVDPPAHPRSAGGRLGRRSLGPEG